MKRVRLYLLLIALCPIGILQAQTSNSRDFTDYAKESLSDFYSTVMEYILDSSDQYAFIENYKDYFAERGTFVSDIITPFPKDELNSFNTYLSNIRVKYQSEFTHSDAVPKIEPTNIVVKKVNAQGQGKGIQIQVAYKVTFYKGRDVLYQGDSEALIAYPNDKNRYAYIVQSVVPKAYSDYRAVLLEGNTKLIQLAKEARRKGNFQQAKKLFEQLVEKGETDCMFDLAELYLYGYEIPLDTLKAKELLERLYATGSPRGVAGMAYLYWNGITMPKDKKKSFDFAIEAAEREDAVGNYLLGLYWLEKDKATHEDTLRAKNYFETAVSKGYPAAYTELANIASKSKDIRLLLHYLEAGCSEGIASCIWQMGNKYQLGYGVPEDHIEAERLYQLAAYTYGSKPAFHALSGIYAITNRDKEKAAACYQKGYDKGITEFAVQLFKYYSGMTYESMSTQTRTDSIVASRSKSLEYLQDALTYDPSDDIAYRAMQICLNEIATPDYSKAFNLASNLHQKGYTEVNYELADMYFNGKGTFKNLNKAEFHYYAYIHRPEFIPDSYKYSGQIVYDDLRWGHDFSKLYRYIYEPAILMRYCLSLFQLGYIAQLRSDYSAALFYYSIATTFCIEFSGKFDHVQIAAVTYFNRGEIYSDKSDRSHYNRSEAISSFREAAKLGFEKANSRLVELGQKPIKQ